VPAFAALGFRQFNAAIFNSIDGTDVHAIRADHLHTLYYSGLRHSSLLAKAQIFGTLHGSREALQKTPDETCAETWSQPCKPCDGDACSALM
jgi:hypothetical protein